MKALIFNEYGDLNQLTYTDAAEIPALKANYVLVNVKAVCLNRMDLMLLGGNLKDFFPLIHPSTAAGDFAGIVLAVGEGVQHLKTGDEVYGQSSQALGGSGSLAEYTLVRGDKVVKKPREITMTESASLPMVGTSAIQALEHHMNLLAGQKILIHGGTGGIGSLAIQLAKHHGAYVATTVDGQYSQLVKELGADEVIDYKTQDFTKLISGYDAVLVNTENALDGSCQILKEKGILVSLVGDVNDELVKKFGITAISQMTEVSQAQLERLSVLINMRAIKPIIDRTFRFEESKGAFTYFEKTHPKGKVVISI